MVGIVEELEKITVTISTCIETGECILRAKRVDPPPVRVDVR